MSDRDVIGRAASIHGWERAKTEPNTRAYVKGERYVFIVYYGNGEVRTARIGQGRINHDHVQRIVAYLTQF